MASATCTWHMLYGEEMQKTTVNMVSHLEKDLAWPLFMEASLGRLVHCPTEYEGGLSETIWQAVKPEIWIQWLTTLSQTCGQWQMFKAHACVCILCLPKLFCSSTYSCHLFLISSASVRSLRFLSFTMPIFAWSVPLISVARIHIKTIPKRSYWPG